MSYRVVYEHKGRAVVASEHDLCVGQRGAIRARQALWLKLRGMGDNSPVRIEAWDDSYSRIAEGRR